MPRLSSRASSGVPPWWKTTLRPVSALVAIDRGGLQAALRDVLADPLERDRALERGLQRRRVQQRVDVEREQAREGQRRAGEPLQVAHRRRRHHVAPADLLPDRAAADEREVAAVGQRRGQIGAVDRADARAEDQVRALGLRQCGEQDREHPGLIGAACAAAGEHERDRLRRHPGAQATASRTVSRNCRAVARCPRSSSSVSPTS